MASSNNYYEWLELSVEKFESDPVKLSDIAEKRIMEWQSHKKIDIQNRANIHGQSIRKAINDSDEWKRIYLEYKSSVDARISESMVFFVNNREIKVDDIKTIGNKFKVSENYVRKICESQNYTVVEGVSSAAKTAVDFTLEDLKPSSYLKFQTNQKYVAEMGAKDLMELLSIPEILGVSVTESTPNDKVIEALAQLKKKWAPISATGEKGTQKSHIDKIYSGFTSILKTVPFGEYIRFLKYLGAKETLTEVLSMHIEELNENAFNIKVTQLFEFTEDREKAKSVLIGFCQEKGIAYPVPRPKLAVCPFCSQSFERTEPIQPSCPVCGRSLTVQCPVCKKSRHIISEPECDGINIGSYPLLEKMLASAEEYCAALNLEAARDKLNDLNSRWQNFPGADKVKERLEKLEKDYGDDIRKISACCEKKEFFSARNIIDRINNSFPDFKKGYGTVYSVIESAEEEFNAAIKESDVDKRINLLLTINDSISDFIKLNAELQKYPVEPVTDFAASVDSSSGVVTLNWKSANKANSVFYIVRRKRDAVVSGVADGEGIGKTQSLSFGDTSAEEGALYYYAVFAMRGTIQSPLSVLNEPTVILNEPIIEIIPKDTCVDLSWKPDRCGLRVFFSDKEISDYDEGTPVEKLSDGGVLLENLTNGTPYCIAAYKYVVSGGKEFRSKLAVFPAVTPIKPVEPPHFTKLIGGKAGEYLLSSESDNEQEITLYYTESRVGISENALISLYDMEKKAKKLNYEKLSDGKYKVDMSDKKSMFVYPTINMSGSLMVGNIIPLTYIELVDIAASVSGSTLCLTISEWPEGMEQIAVCYDFNAFPMDSTDCDRANKIIVHKKDYDKNPILAVPGVKTEKYYISLFARSAGDETLMGNKEVNLAKKSEIRYSVKKNILGGVKITLINDGGIRPPLTFAVGSGCIPLSKEKAVFTFDISGSDNPPHTEVISVPRFGIPKNAYVKIFCEDAGFTVLAEGNTRL